ncbi:uncharacterized protein LY89DRAFT_684469 [Mollisia scopiformis]|uniref:Uncharacterized protein n=1 Tax=Mollisia scopiformis TaxID=149040 RepID=A0A194XCE9_MOLSC|nr:uncharacterized protein LY89DRAFT_684469 [Mollisia scopiformis]KUJ17422.1 hypothetical protein LY89DRAFT_684469 [Mollisia scopiformis]
MQEIPFSGGSSNRYQTLVERTSVGIPTFAPLHKFLLSEASDNITCKISLIDFDEDHHTGEEQGQHPNTQKKEKTIEPQTIKPESLEDLLKQPATHRLLLVENLTRNVIILLGTYWNVPPDFFLAHLENSNWYSLQNIPQILPGLSSIQSFDGYVRFQFIGPREFEIEGSAGPQAPGASGDHNLLPDRIHEDCATASVPRVAGGFTPFPPPNTDPDDDCETKMNPVAFVRNSVTIWFDQEGEKWRRGIVLFDPAFAAKDDRLNKKENSKYRSFIRRRPPLEGYSKDDIDQRSSYKESFQKCLQHNKQVREAVGVPRPFVLLEDLCRIIASEWLVFNTYIERELNNIESWFEELGENCNEKQLHDLLLQLMRARRRVTKYDTLVSDQLDLCPAHWKHDSAQIRASCPVSGASATSFSSPLHDFHQVSSHLTHNKTRISQSIKMVTSLMAVRLNNLVAQQNKVIASQSSTLVKQNRNLTKQTETMARQNRLAEARNSSLAFLTGVTSFLLPFTTIAAFMAIPTENGLGPGSERQWVYWVSSSLLASGLVLAFYFDYRRETKKANHTGDDK